MKIRCYFVSNSSSSSFLLTDPTYIKYFNRYENDEVFSTDEIKKTLKFFIVDYVNTFDFSKYGDDTLLCDLLDDIWAKYFAGKVPPYFRYQYMYGIEDFNFFNIAELIKNLPNGMWMTDSYDRDYISEYCHLPYGNGVVLYEGDI